MRRGYSAVITAAVTAAAVLFGIGVAPAVGADEEAPPFEAVELVVSPRDPVLQTSAEEYEFSVLIRNPLAEETAAGELHLSMESQLVKSAEELTAEGPSGGSGGSGGAAAGADAAAVDGTGADAVDADTAAVERIASTEVGATGAESEQVVNVVVPRAEMPLTTNSANGVYLLHAELRFEGQTAETATKEATTPVIWGGAGRGAEVPLSVIVPFVLPSSIDTLPTRSQLDTLTPSWDRLLTQATEMRATLAIDPRIIAGIRAYGTETPENARRLLQRLENTQLDNFLLQFADADPAAQAELGFTELLQPTNLDFTTRFGGFPTTDATPAATDDSGAGNSADATGSAASAADGTAENKAENEGEGDAPAAESPDGGAQNEGENDPDPSAPDPEPVLPSLAELLEWPSELSAGWPAENTADSGTLELLGASGIDTVVLQSDNIAHAGGPLVELDSASIIVTDAELDAAAGRALSSTSETERTAGLSELASRLALGAQQSSPGLVLGLDRGAVAAAEDPALLLERLAEFSWITHTPVTDQASGTGTLRPRAPAEERIDELKAAADRENAVNEVGQVLVNPEYLSGYQRSRLLDFFATRYAAPTAGFATVAKKFRDRDAELLTGVQALNAAHTQLVSTSTRFPVQLHNSLPFDARVSVSVRPASAGLAVSETEFEDVHVTAESNERVLVPVTSRVSSGESGLIVSVSSADGEFTSYTGTLPISIRSNVETIGIWILGILAAMLLGFGIVRSLRRRKHGPDETEEAEEAEE